MNYEYKIPDKVKGLWKDSNGNVWEYGEKYGRVFGEVSKRVTLDTDDILSNENCQIEVMPTRKKAGLLDRNIGYIHCCHNGEDGCVRIIGKSYLRIVVILFIIAICMGSGILWMSRHQKALKEDEVMYLELPDSMQNDDADSFSIPDYTSITKDVQKDKTDTWLFNVDGNPCDVRYEIYLSGEQEAIYSSEILKAGQVIQGMTLERELSVGNYNYTMICILYEAGTQKVIGEQTLEGVLEVYAKT